VAALEDAAYGHYVERLGMLPRPMTDDYTEVIANQRVTVAESHGTIVGVKVLTVDHEGLLIDNVAVDPSYRGQGPPSSFQKAQPLELRICTQL
jgi:N-acetylglutamate synthase-like GNAT family acetyltransferase